MKMELIQPFINAADAVLSQGLNSPMEIGNFTMDKEAYRRKGVAAMVELSGDIEGRVIFDVTPKTAAWTNQRRWHSRVTPQAAANTTPRYFAPTSSPAATPARQA